MSDEYYPASAGPRDWQNAGVARNAYDPGEFSVEPPADILCPCGRPAHAYYSAVGGSIKDLQNVALCYGHAQHLNAEIFPTGSHLRANPIYRARPSAKSPEPDSRGYESAQAWAEKHSQPNYENTAETIFVSQDRPPHSLPRIPSVRYSVPRGQSAANPGNAGRSRSGGPSGPNLAGRRNPLARQPGSQRSRGETGSGYSQAAPPAGMQAPLTAAPGLAVERYYPPEVQRVDAVFDQWTRGGEGYKAAKICGAARCNKEVTGKGIYCSKACKQWVHDEKVRQDKRVKAAASSARVGRLSVQNEHKKPESIAGKYFS